MSFFFFFFLFLFFLWINKKKYPKIIIKYSSLSSPLVTVKLKYVINRDAEREVAGNINKLNSAKKTKQYFLKQKGQQVTLL